MLQIKNRRRFFIFILFFKFCMCAIGSNILYSKLGFACFIFRRIQQLLFLEPYKEVHCLSAFF